MLWLQAEASAFITLGTGHLQFELPLAGVVSMLYALAILCPLCICVFVSVFVGRLRILTFSGL